MKKVFFIAVLTAIAGCVTTKPVVPELTGKPRIKINEQPQALPADVPLDAVPVEAPAPDNKDTKGSNKNVRKKTKAGNTNR